MTQRDREDLFIERCRKDLGMLTWESELLLRYGYSAGAQELGRVAYGEGMDDQRELVLAALGAAPRKERPQP